MWNDWAIFISSRICEKEYSEECGHLLAQGEWLDVSQHFRGGRLEEEVRKRFL